MNASIGHQQSVEDEEGGRLDLDAALRDSQVGEVLDGLDQRAGVVIVEDGVYFTIASEGPADEVTVRFLDMRNGHDATRACH